MPNIVVLGIPISQHDASVWQDLHQRIHQIVVSSREHMQCLLELFCLLIPLSFWNDNDQTAMNIHLRIFFQEVATIARDDNVAVGNGERHQIPVLPSGLSICVTVIVGTRPVIVAPDLSQTRRNAAV
jgi:hypothetical protein